MKKVFFEALHHGRSEPGAPPTEPAHPTRICLHPQSARDMAGASTVAENGLGDGGGATIGKINGKNVVDAKKKAQGSDEATQDAEVNDGDEADDDAEYNSLAPSSPPASSTGHSTPPRATSAIAAALPRRLVMVAAAAEKVRWVGGWPKACTP